MKRFYEQPEFELIKFSFPDVLASSYPEEEDLGEQGNESSAITGGEEW